MGAGASTCCTGRPANLKRANSLFGLKKRRVLSKNGEEFHEQGIDRYSIKEVFFFRENLLIVHLDDRTALTFKILPEGDLERVDSLDLTGFDFIGVSQETLIAGKINESGSLIRLEQFSMSPSLDKWELVKEKVVEVLPEFSTVKKMLVFNLHVVLQINDDAFMDFPDLNKNSEIVQIGKIDCLAINDKLLYISQPNISDATPNPSSSSSLLVYKNSIFQATLPFQNEEIQCMAAFNDLLFIGTDKFLYKLIDLQLMAKVECTNLIGPLVYGPYANGPLLCKQSDQTIISYMVSAEAFINRRTEIDPSMEVVLKSSVQLLAVEPNERIWVLCMEEKNIICYTLELK
jgi:hypothetical protein